MISPIRGNRTGFRVQVSDTLNPHEWPFTGMLDRHRAQPPAAAGALFFLLLAGRASFPWLGYQWSVPMVTESAS